MKTIFWISTVGVTYAYFGYPLVLLLMGLIKQSRAEYQRISPNDAPDISIIIPAHNEADIIGKKLENTLSLYYPGQMQVIVVSDGSTDATPEIAASFLSDSRLVFVDLPERRGKANALNKGIELATGEIIVFSDASIILENQAIWEIAQPFSNSAVGCVSGEDRIDGGGGEGLYGRYELFLRRYESKVGSIVGASGSIYAQRKNLVSDFPEGVAPDFLSVLNTAERGFRAISTPNVVGYMKAVADSKNEFQRKTRTVIRGMTALFQKKSMLNPLRYGSFSIFLFSHKIVRWCVPFFLVMILASNLFLLDMALYQSFFVAQVLFYAIAILAFMNIAPIASWSLGRVSMYFTVSNLGILVAWAQYFRGLRQEVWGPSKRTV